MAEEIDRQLSRLDVESGDILVLRTRQKLQPATASAWQDELLALCRTQGVRDVTILVLDDSSDLTVTRPATTLMQNQAPRAPHVVTA